MDAKYCKGCRDDFYNQSGNSSEGKCWLLKAAKLRTRYRIHRDTMPAWKGAFTEVEAPGCYSSPPWFYYEQLPDFVRTEDVIRCRVSK